MRSGPDAVPAGHTGFPREYPMELVIHPLLKDGVASSTLILHSVTQEQRVKCSDLVLII